MLEEQTYFISDVDGSVAESPGTVLFSNGVPYTYQNGMAIFHSPEGGYPVAQAQVSFSSNSLFNLCILMDFPIQINTISL